MGSSKGITVVARLLGGKQIETESARISESIDGMTADTKAADERVGESGGGFELFRAKQQKALKDGEEDQRSFLKTTGSTLARYGAMFGSAVIVGGGYESIKKALAIEKTEAALRNALKNTGQLHGNTMQEITAATKRASVHGGFTQQEQLQGVTQLVTQTGSHTMALKLNAAAMNLARGSGMEYAAALKVMTMGQTGATGRAQKYLGIIQPIKSAVNAMTTAEKENNKPKLEAAELWDKQATARKMLGIVEAKYHGATAAYSKTAAGQISNLKNTFEDLEVTVGKKLIPPMTKFLQVGTSILTWTLKSKAALIGVGGAVGFLMAAFAIEKVIGFVNAVKELTLVTKLQTGAQWLLNVAMDANPIVLAIGALVALGAAVYVLYTKVTWFREGVQSAFRFVKNIVVDVFEWIKGHWPLLAGILFGPFGLVAGEIIQHWSSVVGFFKSIPGKLAAAGKGMWNFVKVEFKSVIDWILRGWNKLHFRMPGVHTPFGTIGGFNIGLPQIPLLGEGGTIRERGTVVVGDRGPELLSLPPGARVDPLLPGDRPQGAAGTWRGRGGNLTVICQIDRKEVARAVLNEFDRENARGNR